MAGSDDSNSVAEIKKKTSVLDEDFGKDFLFWGSTKKGNDKNDFDMGEAPRNKKKPFDFDKLDDFELGGDFGKLPNFKMKMTDLDFSSPDIDSGKPTAKSAEKQESKKDDFSFNFDFELDKFDFGSGPSESKSKPSTFKQAMNHDSKSNSCTSTDLLKDMEKSKPLDKISATSKHENMLDSNPSTSENPQHNVMSHELLSEMKKTSISDRNKDKTCRYEEGDKQQSHETCFASINTPKNTQDFILQSQPSACSEDEDNQQFAVRVESAMEKTSSMRTTDNSHSKHSIPENSCNSECFHEARMNEYSTGNGSLQSKFEGNQNVIACEMEVPRDQGQLRVQNLALTDISIARGMTNTEEKHGSGSNLNLPSRKSYSSPVKPMSLNDKLASALQKRSLKKSAENVLHHASVATNREAKKNHEHAESFKAAITEPYEAGPIKEVSYNSSREKENRQTYSSFQLKTSSIQQQNATTSLGSYKDAPEMDDSSLTDKRNFVSRFNISSVPTTTQRVENLVTFKERSLKFPVKVLSKSSVKSGSVSAILKRKTFEVLPSVPEKLKSLKHDMESANERKSVDTFQKSENTLRIAIPDMSNTDHYNDSVKEVLDVAVHQKDGEIDKTKNKTAPVQHNTYEELNREDTKNDPYKEQIEESSFIKPCAENVNQDTTLTLPNETESSISPKPASVKEQNDSMSTVGSSHSRNSNPDNSFHSRLNDRENEILSKLNLSDSNQNHLKIHIDSSKDVSENNQDLHGEFNQSPLHRSSNSLKVTTREKVMAIIQSSDKPAQNAHLKFLPVNDKEASPDIKELKALNLSPLSDSRFSKQNHEHIQEQNIIMLKSNDIFSNKGLSVEKSDTSWLKLKPSNLLDNPKGISTLTSMSPSLAKLNIQMLKPGTEKEAKIAIVAESNSKSPLRKAKINSATEKSDSCAVPLKRKTFEESTNLNPLKRVAESPAGRKPTNISPKTAMVPVTENFGESHGEERVNDLNSTHVPELGDITTGIERLAPYEKDEIVEKAELYRKELEDMCGKLRKQHDEARELIFRAAVNDNSNKKLKPKYQHLDEKIRSLQKFAASLQAKKF